MCSGALFICCCCEDTNKFIPCPVDIFGSGHRTTKLYFPFSIVFARYQKGSSSQNILMLGTHLSRAAFCGTIACACGSDL